MIRTTCFALAMILLGCGHARAEFLIDSFNNLDTDPTAGNSVLAHAASSQNSADIFVDVTADLGGSGLFVASNGLYGLQNGNKLQLDYTWDTGIAPTFGDLQTISGLQIESFSLGLASVGGTWNLRISDGTTTFYDGLLNSFGQSSQIDSATNLSFEFDLVAPSVFGTSEIVIGNKLYATPEPTAFVMLSSVGLLGLIRRRRRRCD